MIRTSRDCLNRRYGPTEGGSEEARNLLLASEPFSLGCEVRILPRDRGGGEARPLVFVLGAS